MSLKNIGLAHSPLSDSIYLVRVGKDPHLALEKREAEADVFRVLVDHMMYDAPNGSIKNFTLDGKRYKLTLKPIEEDDTND